MKGLGVSLLLINAVQRAAQMVVASEAIYMATLLLESSNAIVTVDNECQSELLSGFCHKLVQLNLTQTDCDRLNYTDTQSEWGICGKMSEARINVTKVKSHSNHFLWEKVLIYNISLATSHFAGPKLRTTDLMMGKMQQGFKTDPDLLVELHWNLMTFVFSLTYLGLLSVLVLSQDTIWTLMHILSISSSLCLFLANFVAAASSSSWEQNSFRYGWKHFASNQLNSGFWGQPTIWIDALILGMWNTGVMSGELISLGKLNAFGQNTILTSLFEISAHCALNRLNAVFVSTMSVNYFSKHYTAPFESYGYTHMLMEVHPNILVEVYYVLGILPLACFAIDELCAFVSFKNTVVNSLIDIWPELGRLASPLYLTLYLCFMTLCTPLCVQYNMGVVYDYNKIAWGWNNLMLLGIMMLAFWSYMRPTDGIFVLFKRLGLSDQIINLNYWWRLCWLFYTPVLLILSMLVLTYESVRQSTLNPGFAEKIFYSGPLQLLTEEQMKRYLWEWWVVDAARGFTVLPALIGAVLGICLSAGDAANDGKAATESDEKSATAADSRKKKRRIMRFRDTWIELTEDLKMFKRE